MWKSASRSCYRSPCYTGLDMSSRWVIIACPGSYWTVCSLLAIMAEEPQRSDSRTTWKHSLVPVKLSILDEWFKTISHIGGWFYTYWSLCPSLCVCCNIRVYIVCQIYCWSFPAGCQFFCRSWHLIWWVSKSVDRMNGLQLNHTNGNVGRTVLFPRCWLVQASCWRNWWRKSVQPCFTAVAIGKGS